jgi:hypothetical protein
MWLAIATHGTMKNHVNPIRNRVWRSIDGHGSMQAREMQMTDTFQKKYRACSDLAIDPSEERSCKTCRRRDIVHRNDCDRPTSEDNV